MKLKFIPILGVLIMSFMFYSCEESDPPSEQVEIGSFYEPDVGWELDFYPALHEEATLKVDLSFPRLMLDSLNYLEIDTLEMYAMYIGDSSYFQYNFGETVWESSVDIHDGVTFQIPVKPQETGTLAMWLMFLVVREDPSEPLRYENLISNTLYFNMEVGE